MKFSVPIYILKQKAKVFARNNGIPLHDALDRIAKEQKFGSWSLLAELERGQRERFAVVTIATRLHA